MTFTGRVLGAVVGSFLVGLGLVWLLFVVWLHAPASHVRSAVWYFLTSGAIALLVGSLAMACAARLVPKLGLKIVVASLAGSAAAIVAVLYTPLLMFAESTDKDILVITMLYFLALSGGFAVLVAAFTTRQIDALRVGAMRLAAGDLSTRVVVQGSDEVADLGRAFNRMSTELDASFVRERQLEGQRRDLMAAVSHDLRTPLTSIRAMIEAINDGVVSDPHQVRRYLGVVQRESEHLGRLIEDLFELARIDGGTLDLRLGSVPLAELVIETTEGLRLQAVEKGIDLQVEVQGDVPPMALDAPRMQRVFVNLIGNALRHTPPGGTVQVVVRFHDGHPQVVVTDSGEGIAAEDRPRVFDRFYRSEKSRSRDNGGAGLGLAIARGIVEAHHGVIGVDSTPGRGARFVVTL